MLPAPYEGPPLTIGYVGNFTRPWCTEVHVANSLEADGHKVYRFQENQQDWRRLGEKVRRGCQVVLWTRTWEVPKADALRFLAEMRDVGVPTVGYHLDRWWGLEREYQLDTEPFFRCALVVSPDGSPVDWARPGINHLWLPPGVFGPECLPLNLPLKREVLPVEPVIFVGSYPYPHPGWAPYRMRLIEELTYRYGGRFGLYPKDKRRPIRGLDLTRLYQSSKVVIGDSCLLGQPHRYWSDRVPETLGRGGVLVHPEVDGLDDFYRDDAHLRTYEVGDFEQLLGIVDELLDGDDVRESLRAEGQALVLERDTYQQRMRQVLGHVQRELGIPERAARATGGRVNTAPLIGAGMVPPRSFLPVVRVGYSRRPRITHAFQLAQGDTDRTALDEVWKADDYRTADLVKAGAVVLDVGANVGAFSVLAAKLGAKVVHAYEPHPATRDALYANAKGLAVEVHPEALVAGYGPTAVLLGDGGGATITAGEGQEVPSACFADVVEDLARWHGQVDVVKMDCEGAEYELLAAVDLDRIAAMALEFHGPGMPHLTHLDADGRHLERWASIVTRLAQRGRLEIFGRPSVGGLIQWRRF